MSDFATTSVIEPGAGRKTLRLATALGATPTGPVEHPAFFSGLLVRPDVAASGILAVADVAMARYADAGLMKRVLASLDPLVTASGDRLRFESFSSCNGVYARFDLLSDGVDGAEVGFGTTNVDINQPLRSALTRVGRADLLHLEVGDDALTASSLEQTHIEERVSLPDRWVRGCAEVPGVAIRMRPAFTLHGPAITRLLGLLPSGMPPGPTLHLLAVGGVVRATPQPLPGTVPVTGTARLGAAARLARHATTLSIHVGASGTSAWVFEVPGGRLTLMLSPGPYRGFSGEGGLLTLLADPAAELVGRRLLDDLAWCPVIDPEGLAETSGLTQDEVRAGLAWLSASGQVGYDLTEHRYFHRDLPADSAQVLRRSPRLVAAQRLVDRGAVTRNGNGWIVDGEHARYGVEDDRCGCEWYAEHRGSRGPCKHVLAAALVASQASPTSGSSTMALPSRTTSAG